MLARHTRAFGALGDPAHASSLESALVRAGRLEEAYLLRWRRGEPSLASPSLVDAQRPTLATLTALDAGPPTEVVPCDVCGPLGCGRALVQVATGSSRDELRWTHLGARVVLPDAPVVAARGVSRAEELAALTSLGTVSELGLSSTALRTGATLPPTTESVALHLGDGDHAALYPQYLAGLERLRALVLQGRITDERLDGLLAACEGRLERLRVDASLLTDAGLEALSLTPRLLDLRLDAASWVDGSCLRALVDVGAPLERFSLRNARCSTWRTLDAVGSLETVTDIDLDAVALDDDGLDALAPLPRLRRLALTCCAVGPNALDGIEEAPLEHVELAHVAGVDDAALEVLASSTTLRQLVARSVRDPSPRGWSALARAPRLEQLTLDRCSQDAEALVAIARSSSLVDVTLEEGEPLAALEGCMAVGKMPRLERLSLAGFFAVPEVMTALVEAATSLTTLVLSPRWVTVSHALLAPVGRLPRVERLTVEQPSEPGAIAALASARELQELTLAGTSSLDDAEVRALRACLSLRVLRLRCDEQRRQHLADALPGVDVQAVHPSWRSRIAES